jgi:hypothetical protein
MVDEVIELDNLQEYLEEQKGDILWITNMISGLHTITHKIMFL